MEMAEDGLAGHGFVVCAKHQIEGKGQRGKAWIDSPENLKFSLIVTPSDGFGLIQLNLLVSTMIAGYLKTILPEGNKVALKWPNDVYVNDKKAAGVLIENTFRGSSWSHAIIGIGLNVNHPSQSLVVPRSTSLAEAAGRLFDLFEIINDLRAGILNGIKGRVALKTLLDEYNSWLYRRGRTLQFVDLRTASEFQATVMGVNEKGNLLLSKANRTEEYPHGSIRWVEV